MLKKIKLTLVAVLALGFFAAPVAVMQTASAQDIKGGLCEGANLQFNNQSGCTNANTNEDSINRLIERVVNIISVIVGIVAVIMIIWGGFKYITSGGDSSNISAAKNTILYAIIGLVIVALAQFIVKFVLTESNNVVQ